MEVRRWSPDAEARAGVAVAPGADPTLMHMVQMAGLLGEEATMAERTTEYLCSGGCLLGGAHRLDCMAGGAEGCLAGGAARLAACVAPACQA